MHDWYPVMVRLSGRNCLVAGGGKIAERRAQALLSCGAAVTVVSPAVTDVLRGWGDAGQVALRLREYRPEDMSGMFLAIAATDDSEANRRIGDDARSAGTLFSRTDEPDAADFIVPSTLRRGKLVMAVTTSGASPTLAAKIRSNLEAQYGEEYEQLLELLSDIRVKLKETVMDPAQRRRLLGDLPFMDILEQIRAGHTAACRRDMLEWAGKSPLSEIPMRKK